MGLYSITLAIPPANSREPWEMSDRPFLEKRGMDGGFADSPIRLNAGLAALERWNEDEIVRRAGMLAEKACSIWRYPNLAGEILERYAREGDEEDEDEDESQAPTWEQRLEAASEANRHTVEMMMAAINDRFDCISEPTFVWMFLYTKSPTERRNLFAVLTCGKNVTNVCFRANPGAFGDDDNEDVRKVKGWFFHGDVERRIRVEPDTIPKILTYLEHAYDTTCRRDGLDGGTFWGR